MSILNRPSDGLFNALIALTKCLVSQGPLNRDKLLNLCIPKSLDPKQDMATKTLNRWVELGLLELQDDVVSITEDFKGTLNKKSYSINSLTIAVSQKVFAPDNNKNFWASEENRAADFSRAQAWMLAQDVYSFQPKSHPEVEKVVASQMEAKEYSVFQNNTRWNGFESWSSFLGFGSKSFGPFVVDPTNAIRPYIGDLFPKKESVPIAEVVEAFAIKVPVLDGGDYRKVVEEKMQPAKWNRPKANELSTSLSRAFLRLHEDGTLEIEDKADAKDKRVLLGRDSKALRTISHVRLGSKKQ